jgi:flagellar motor component MotA
MSMINLESRKFIKCPKGARQALVPLVEQIVELAHLSRKEGMLGLEDYIPNLESYLLRLGINR